MNFIRGLLSFLTLDMTEPKSYGWFHFLFVAIMLGLTIFLCVKHKDASDKVFRRIVFICWIVIVVLELYKQFEFSYTIGEESITWDYQWYAFPYQLCSTPLYALPFIIFMKDSKFRDAFIAYMSTFSLFGGLVTFIYPEQVFVPTIGINIQTMVHHGLQIVLGIFFIVYARKKFTIKYYLKGIPVFASFIAIALIVNELFVAIASTNETFNMFYISRHFDCILPILDMVYDKLWYGLFLLVYILGFVLVSAIIFSIAKLVIYIVKRAKSRA